MEAQMDMQRTYKVVHLSSVHKDRDVRIFLKECGSLANTAEDRPIRYDVHLVLTNVEERKENGLTIHSVSGDASNRLKRMWTTVNRVYKKALEIDADVYHLHDPELLRIALKLKRAGKKVVYDAHEDLPRQIIGKHYLRFKKTISKVMERYENKKVRRLDAVVTATPFIRDRFLNIHPNTVDINNFPVLSEVDMSTGNSEKKGQVCFIGGISAIRGTKQLVQAMGKTSLRCALAGAIPDGFRSDLESENGWKQVDELGFISRAEALKVKSESIAGIVTFLPLPNHVNAQPNKIFEYMASGLPVIGSHFPLWKEIIEKNDCGICVDPEKPEELTNAMNYLKSNPEKAIEMGERGKKCVLEKYNWGVEEQKLLAMYDGLLQS